MVHGARPLEFVDCSVVAYDQNMAGFLGVSGQLTMTAATLELAVEQNITPRDAGEPVSP